MFICDIIFCRPPLSPFAFRAIWPHQLCVQCVAFCLATNVFGRRAYFSRVFADPFCECQSGTSLTPPVVHSRHQCSGHPLSVVSTRHGHQSRCQLVPHVLARPCFTLCHRRVVFLVKCVCVCSSLLACACMWNLAGSCLAIIWSTNRHAIVPARVRFSPCLVCQRQSCGRSCTHTPKRRDRLPYRVPPSRPRHPTYLYSFLVEADQ